MVLGQIIGIVLVIGLIGFALRQNKAQVRPSRGLGYPEERKASRAEAVAGTERKNLNSGDPYFDNRELEGTNSLI